MMKVYNNREIAYNYIKDKIIRTEYPPGIKISEKMIGEETGLNRTPIREAFIRLSDDDLLDIFPQNGTYVSKINMNRARSALYLRKKVESPIFEESTSFIDGKLRDKIEENLRLLEKYAKEKDNYNFFESDNNFHYCFYEATSQGQIWEWLQSVYSDLNRVRWLRLTISELPLQQVLSEHQLIWENIQNGNIEDFRKNFEKHLSLDTQEVETLQKMYPDYFQQ